MRKEKFDAFLPQKLEKTKEGRNWPVTYILYNQKEAYIGQTMNASARMKEHLKDEKKKNLKHAIIITDETFHKSAALDFEYYFIKYMFADEKFKLLNANSGLRNHNYYKKEEYLKKKDQVWEKLRFLKLAKNDIRVIENSELFKFSPYQSLIPEQYEIVKTILQKLTMVMDNQEKSSFIIHGGSGTGKTLLGIYIMKLLAENKNELNFEEDEIDSDLKYAFQIKEKYPNLKIGFVISMSCFRETIKKVFRKIKGLNADMVLSPHELVKNEENYDLLIIDEAHRLRQEINLTNHKTFRKDNEMLGLSNSATELDWVRLKSKYQIFFYDEDQRIKPTDVPKEKFEELKKEKNSYSYELKVQMRCLLGGEKYVNYIKSIFSNNPPKRKILFEKYELKLFDDVNDMIENIKQKNDKYGLCRNLAGISFSWDKKKTDKDYDIKINDYHYKWNTKATDWINSKNSIHEIGCIHTIQGLELNYAGVIIGNELKYDQKEKRIYVDAKNYKDLNGKKGTNDKELLEYIERIYSTLCLRAMKGTYLYVCDPNLKKYMQKYIDQYDKK